MQCFFPKQGFEKKGMTVNGKFGFTESKKWARLVNGIPVTRIVPCRKCESCRLGYSKEWCTKIMCEASLYFQPMRFEDGILLPPGYNVSFITLTYDDISIPDYGSLDYKGHWTDFLKRLRKALEPTQIRYYVVGEYGDLNLRPHYHAIIFGYDFPDKYLHSVHNNNLIFRSSFLEELWTFPRGHEFAGRSMGYSSVCEVSVAVAAYVARYSMKKVIGEDPDEYNGRYIRYDKEYGHQVFVQPERALMSNGAGSKDNAGGIGKRWFDKYGLSDVYSKQPDGSYKDSIHLFDGSVVRPPTYYDRLIERVDPKRLEEIKLARQDFHSAHASEFTPERLAQKRACLLNSISQLKRNIRKVYNGA